jgi:hypothetical protein
MMSSWFSKSCVKFTRRERGSSVDFLRCDIPTITWLMMMALIAWMQSA